MKLLDYAKDWAALESNPNPFATVVMAHLKTKETTQDPESRKDWKFRLVRSLFERGFDADRIRKLFRFIDWIMSLPKALDASFWQDMQKVQQEKRMPYITSVERIGMEKGHLLGIIESIERALNARFHDSGLDLMTAIQQIKDIDLLRQIHEKAVIAADLDEVRKLLP